MSSNNPRLILNTDNIAGYTLPNMPFTGEKTLSLAFGGAQISFVTVNSSYGEASVAAASYKGLAEPAFYIKNDGDSPELHRSLIRTGTQACGYAFGVFTLNPAVTVLGQYHVGKTKLKEFSDGYLNLDEVCVKDRVIYCPSNDDANFGYQLSFTAPDDFVGDLAKANAQQLGEAVLTEAYFLVANRRQRKKPTLTAQEGMNMAKKAKWAGRAASLFGKDHNDQAKAQTPLNPIARLVESQASPNSAMASYQYLIENSLHNNSVEELHNLTKRVFEQHPNQDLSFYFDALTGFTGEFTQSSFVLIQDWKQDIRDTVAAVTNILGDRLSEKLPGTDVFGEVGVSHPEFISAIEDVLTKNDIGLKILDNGSDQLFFLMFEMGKKGEIEKCLTVIQPNE